MKKNSLLVAAVLALGLLATAGCKKKGEATPAPTAKAADTGSAATPTPTPASGSAAIAPNAPPAAAATKNLLDTAKQVGTFSRFLKAVDAAGIAENLNGAGPFTVFAPTDDAFAKLPAKDLEALLADKAKLAQVLQYHVISGSVLAKDLATVKTEKSVQGADLAIDASSGVKVGGATVTKPDLLATNGVIHAIDTVLLPPAK